MELKRCSDTHFARIVLLQFSTDHTTAVATETLPIQLRGGRGAKVAPNGKGIALKVRSRMYIYFPPLSI